MTTNQIREVVISFMHYKGENYNKIPPHKWEYIYLNLCNGFGELTRKQAIEQSWDWSHVRDSDEVAFNKIYLYLKLSGRMYVY